MRTLSQQTQAFQITMSSDIREEYEATQYFITQLRNKRSNPATPPLDLNERNRLKQLYRERKQLQAELRKIRNLKKGRRIQ